MNAVGASTLFEVAKARQASDVRHQYLTFLLAGQSFAFPLVDVAEITPNAELNRMPHMPKSVEGILDLRGSVLPVINLRVRLGLAAQEAKPFENILILDAGGGHTGVLVDNVDCVVTIQPEQLVGCSPLLAGPDGRWISGFVRTDQRIIAILDTKVITNTSSTRGHAASYIHADVDRELDESLVKLIELAPHREVEDRAKIIPQMEAAIAHTEEEMGKVLARVEGMLSGADRAFKGLARLKQEVQLGRFSGEEATVAEIERTGAQIQDTIFELLQQLQFQDIARQKLERVLNHVRGLQSVVGQKFRDATK